MRRFLLFSFTVVALVVLALPALAGRPECGPDATYPWCDTATTTSSTTSTTTTTLPDELGVCSDTMVISDKGSSSFSCLWTPDRGESADPPRTATVSISALWGGVKGPPTVFVRDDSPGDICLLTDMEGFEWQVYPGPEYNAEFKLVYDSVPVGDDILDYSAWLGRNYWDFEYDPADPVAGEHWCAPQDPILDSIRHDTNGTPLHFMVSYNARGGGGFTVTLSPGQG